MNDRIDAQLLESFFDQGGVTLAELSRRAPVLLVFLRHSGCTFCREALSDLRRDRAQIEARGATIAVVHMLPDARAKAFVADYDLGDIPRFSDPDKRLYNAFGLRRGTFGQLLGLKSWARGIKAGLVDGHGVGMIGGDPLQMPGAFLLHDGAIVAAFRHESAADRPDYTALASCEIIPAGGRS